MVGCEVVHGLWEGFLRFERDGKVCFDSDRRNDVHSD
jgi:hypothetical protein